MMAYRNPDRDFTYSVTAIPCAPGGFTDNIARERLS